ncbi:unnamed protein product [Paramecium sonneborni]|uniref:Uncharacterized protein n=1 Tax=Paramecium sonneborni TaxID=65129 RepID=A0A8S1LUW0_9CILI|nr:unnamed protein product [Paramecium sonneborni]
MESSQYMSFSKQTIRKFDQQKNMRKKEQCCQIIN